MTERTRLSDDPPGQTAPNSLTRPAPETVGLLDVIPADPLTKRPLLEADLRHAIERQELRVFYQPMLSLHTRRITGFEALLRWQSPSRGLIAPAEFLQLAEETGLIVPLGLWVLRNACARARAWQMRYPQTPPLLISVNLSASQFEQPDLVEQIGRILAETGLPPGTLDLEITETLVMQNPETARAMLLQLRALDVRLGIDDFGTGFSSLSYVGKFPVHALKIDRSFIAHLEDRKENLEIVRAITTMARNLGLEVTAEGVETAGQLTLLKFLKCDRVQGYLVSKPLDEERAETLITMAPAGHFEGLIPGDASTGDASEGPVAPGVGIDRSAPVVTPEPLVAGGARPATLLKVLIGGCALLAMTISGILMLPGQSSPPGQEKESVPVEQAVTAQPPSALNTDEVRSSMSAGHYVLPRRNNAVYFCNQLLAKDPQDTMALHLKEQSVGFALARAEEKSRADETDEAKQLYQALLSLLKGDKRFAGRSRDAQQGLNRIEFMTYDVEHDHFIDRCRGQLKFNSYTMSFLPLDASRHGFAEKVDKISARMDGKVLKIIVQGKTYKFKSPSPGIDVVYQELARRL